MQHIALLSSSGVYSSIKTQDFLNLYIITHLTPATSIQVVILFVKNNFSITALYGLYFFIR